MDMKDIVKYHELTKECEEMIKACGFDVPYIHYSLSPTKGSWLGRCIIQRNYFSDDDITIKLSARYFEAYLKTGQIEKIKDTILHEICHALPNGAGHGYQWKRYADVVNRKYGYDIKRLAETDETIKTEKLKTAKYMFVCESCGQIIIRQRESNFTKRYQLYHCGKCKGSFKKV